jgi:DNA-binding CsgD family transcriptional regulator
LQRRRPTTKPLPETNHLNVLCLEVRDEIIVRELIAGKLSRQQIAKMVGCSYTTVRNVELNNHDKMHAAQQQREIEEARQRQEDARVEAQRVHLLLLNAKPDGSKCKVKSCLFPAMVEGFCRHCFRGSLADRSLLPSTLPLSFNHSYGRAEVSRLV